MIEVDRQTDNAQDKHENGHKRHKKVTTEESLDGLLQVDSRATGLPDGRH